MSNSSRDRTLSGGTTPGQGSNGNGRVLCISQSSSIIGDSPSDCLVTYSGHSLGEFLPPLQKDSSSLPSHSDSTDFPDSLCPSDPTIHCFLQVLRATSLLVGQHSCIEVHERSSLMNSSLHLQQSCSSYLDGLWEGR